MIPHDKTWYPIKHDSKKKPRDKIITKPAQTASKVLSFAGDVGDVGDVGTAVPHPVSQAVFGAQRQVPQSRYAAGHPVILEGTGFTGDARNVLRKEWHGGCQGKWHQFSVKHVTHT